MNIKRLYLALLAILFFTFLNNFAIAKPTAEQMLFNSAQGKEFVIAIPANEGHGISVHALEIYVTSSKDCMVQLTMPAGGVITKAVKAMQITTFSTLNSNEIGWDLEVIDSQRPLSQAVILTSAQPISVYVLNSKTTTSDGFLAVPTSAWGKKYYHCSYYDFKEYTDLKGGFIVVASQDGTKISVNLKGRGSALTDKKSKLGTSLSATLNRGQIYMVQGDGSSRGSFDLSGTSVIATKPVGLVSYHQRTMIPSYDIWNGRDHLSEMLIPVQAWGKKYTTIDFKRDKGQGDFFRIMCSEDNTNWKCTYYDPKDGRPLGNLGGTLKKAGDFEEYNETVAKLGADQKGVIGTSVWEADKPIQVMQYAYSSEWDGNPIFDPFQVLVVPEEQYIPSTVFQTPANQAFTTNWFNIIAKHDTNDATFEDLKSIKIDGKPVWVTNPQFLFNKVPNTSLYWARLATFPGAHNIKGNGIKFGGYIYGFSSYDSYGWPAAMAINNTSEVDTLAPELTKKTECGDYEYHATELRNGKDGDNPMQIDQGLYHIELDDSLSFNYNLDTLNFNTEPHLYEYTFQVKVIDKTKKGLAVIHVADRYGNTTTDSVSWEPATLALNPKIVNFGRVRVKGTKNLIAQLKNESDSVIVISELKLKISDEFKILSGTTPPDITLKPGDIHNIVISYNPKDETVDTTKIDIDSILIKTVCINYAFPVKGLGVIPKITVEDWNAGSVLINNQTCKESGSTKIGLAIDNPGTDTLHIVDIKNVAAPFSLSTPTNPPMPIIIPPGKTVYLESICFKPTEPKDYTIDVEFVCDADMGDPKNDNVSNWKGKGLAPGPYITSYDWMERRVKTVNDSVLILKNSGTSTINVIGLNTLTNPNFKIVSTDPVFDSGNPARLAPETASAGLTEIKIYVNFTPQAEGPTTADVIPEFDPKDGIIAGSVVGTLKGIGILPKIEVVGWHYPTPIMINTVYPTKGYITIKSTSTTADLFIEKILPFIGPAAAEFTLDTISPTNLVLKRGTSITIPVIFTGKGLLDRNATVTVVSDAAEGPKVDPRVNTTGDLLGHVFETGAKVDSLNYGNVSLCLAPSLRFFIKNLSSTNTLRVDSVKLVSGDIANFEVKESFPLTVNQFAQANPAVTFKPNAARKFSALLRVYTEIGSDYYVLLEGTGYTIPAEISLQRFSLSDGIIPGGITRMKVSLKSPEWNKAGVQDIKVEIKYKTNWMRYDSKFALGNITDNSKWTYTFAEQVVDATYSKLVIEGHGTTDITGNGDLCTPEFLILLSNTKEFEPEISVSFFDKDNCIVPTTNPGHVIMNTCVIDLRAIVLNPTDYNLHSIEPNPVSGSKFNVKYDLGLTAETNLSLYNSNGVLIQTIVNGKQETGTHSIDIDSQNLSSGSYFLKLSSGPYSDTKSVIIAK
jgi:hypothetical protein